MGVGIRGGFLEQMTCEPRPEEIGASWERIKRDAELPSPDAERCCVCSRKEGPCRAVRDRHEMALETRRLGRFPSAGLCSENSSKERPWIARTVPDVGGVYF